MLHAPHNLAELRTVDEAVVIGAALSLSSSAFVLQVGGGGGGRGCRCSRQRLPVRVTPLWPHAALSPPPPPPPPRAPQLLRERGELDSRFGQATLGILLLQDIATVPFLVLLPLIEGNNTALLEGQDTMSLVQQLGPTALMTLGGLGAVLLGGRLFMRR